MSAWRTIDRALAALIVATLIVSWTTCAHAEAALVEGQSGNGRWHSFSHNNRTAADAINNAMSNCMQNAFNCHVLRQFNSTCFALAYATQGGYGFAFGRDLPEAHRAALQQCIGGSPYDSCNIVQSFCDVINQQVEDERERVAREAANAAYSQYVANWRACNQNDDEVACDRALSYATSEPDRSRLRASRERIQRNRAEAQARAARQVAELSMPAPAPPIETSPPLPLPTDDVQQTIKAQAHSVLRNLPPLLFPILMLVVVIAFTAALVVPPARTRPARTNAPPPPPLPPPLPEEALPPSRSLTVTTPAIPATTEQEPILFAVDTPAALRALRLANSYLEETVDLSFSEPEEAQTARTTLSLASRQLDIAHGADPNAKHERDDGSLASQAYLRARVLTQEALTWGSENVKRGAVIAERATRADPTFADAFYTLGLFHFHNRDRSAAANALTRALELDPDNIEIQKILDRTENMGATEIATYKATKAGVKVVNTGIGVYNAGVRTWNVFAVCWNIVTFPIRTVARVINFMSGGR